MPQYTELKNNNPASKVTIKADRIIMDGQKLPDNFKRNELVCVPGNNMIFSYDNIGHSEIFNETGHKFQVHHRPVTSLQEAKAVIHSLYQSVDVAASSHLSYAYRVRDIPSETTITGHSDDRDWAAGMVLSDVLAGTNSDNFLIAISHFEGSSGLGKRRLTLVGDLARRVLGDRPNRPF